MQTARIGIAGALMLLTAACANADDVESFNHTVSGTTADAMTRSDLGYGWSTPINESAFGGYTLSEIVTDAKFRVRKDNKSCGNCHTWAQYQDATSFCDRVDDFLKMPTAQGDGKDAPNAKPAKLKKLLEDWKAAGCPE